MHSPCLGLLNWMRHPSRLLKISVDNPIIRRIFMDQMRPETFFLGSVVNISSKHRKKDLRELSFRFLVCFLAILVDETKKKLFLKIKRRAPASRNVSSSIRRQSRREQTTMCHVACRLKSEIFPLRNGEARS